MSTTTLLVSGLPLPLPQPNPNPNPTPNPAPIPTPNQVQKKAGNPLTGAETAAHLERLIQALPHNLPLTTPTLTYPNPSLNPNPNL